MSFLNPAPINNENLNDEFKKYMDNNNNQPRKKNLRKTLKKRREIKNSKVNDFLNSLNDDSSDSENENLGDFKNNNLMPLPNPQINTKKPEPTNNFNEEENTMLDSAVTQEQFKSMESNYNTNYISQYIPYSTNVTNNQEIHGSKDVLLEKLNYMIHLLEEQQEEKTGHVTEELILYCFLGVFMIFVVDSFARVGKYVR